MHEFTDMTENWKENVANVAPVATRRPLRELQLQAGEISLETETLKRKSRWAADIEFRLTLFEQLEPDQWDAQVDVTSADEAPETRLETPERQDVSVDVSVPAWDLEVDLSPPKFPHFDPELQGGQGEHFELHTTLEPDGDGPNGDGSDEWPTPPDSPLPKFRKAPMEDPGADGDHNHSDHNHGDHGDHGDYGSPEVFSFAKSGAMEAIETPICSPIEVIEASVRSAESEHGDHFDVDTIDTCLDTTFDSEAQSLLQMMCSQLKKGLKDSPERLAACEVKSWKPSVKPSVKLSKVAVEPVKPVLTVPSPVAASPESYATSTSTSTSSASRLRSRTLEPLPSWNFDTLRGYLNTFQRSKMRQQQRQQRLQQLTEVEICSLRSVRTPTPRRVRSPDRCPDRSPRSVRAEQVPRQVPRVPDRERSADRVTNACVTCVTSTSTASARSASLSVPGGAPGPMQVHSRGEVWMEHRKKRQYLRREEARQEELKECTFKPQLSSTPRGRVLSSSLSCPKLSQFTPRHECQRHEHRHVELYDRQMQWRQRLEEKWDEARQRKQKEAEQMQLAQPQPQSSQLRLRSPREVNEAFERFHQRSRQWQQACALRVLKAQKSTEEAKMENLQCGRQRSYTKDVTKARRASGDAKELKTCRARSEEPKCRDTPRSKAERHEVHRHLQTLRRALFDSKQWHGTSPRWQKALQVEVARSEGAGAAPIKIS